MNPIERRIRHISSRDEIGRTYKPNQDEISGVISKHAPYINDFVGAIRTPNFFTEISEKCRNTLIKEYDGQSPSASALAAFIVVNMAQVLEERSEAAYDENDILSYVYFSDVGSAVRDSVELIIFAEKAIKQGQDSVAKRGAEMIEEIIATGIPVVNQADLLLSFNIEVFDWLALLKKDKSGSGFLCVEEAAKRLKGEKSEFRQPQIFPIGYIPEFVENGADLGREMYKIVYNLLSSDNAGL